MSYVVNLVLQGRSAVVAGAGTIAARKIDDLLEAGARVTAIAPRACSAVERLADAGRIRLCRRTFEAEDGRGAFLIVAATNDEGVNARIAEAARASGVLVNVVDTPALCDFTIPAVVRRGDLTLAVATEGQCPAFARALREELEDRYGQEYGRALNLLARVRLRLRQAGWDNRRIQQTLSELYRAGIVECVRAGDEKELERLLTSHLPECCLP